MTDEKFFKMPLQHISDIMEHEQILYDNLNGNEENNINNLKNLNIMGKYVK